jgi:hypothetical protein
MVKPKVSTICKIRWHIWDGDTLVVQALTRRVTEKNLELTKITPLGSVKYTFNGIDTKEKVDKLVKDIEDGTIK